MTFIYRNMTIFWDISKWNREKKNETNKILIKLIILSFFHKIFLKIVHKSIPLSIG